jgi:hypothetical protein
LFGSLIVLSATAIKLLKTKIVSLSLVVFISSILIKIGTGLTANAQQQETKVFANGADGAAHELNLRAIKQNNGQIQKVSTFKIQAQNVVQINLGNDIAIFTDPATVQIDKVKVRDQSNKLTELGKVSNNIFISRFSDRCLCT